MPCGVTTNSRTWLEWAMPRDLRILRPRLRSPTPSRSRTEIQVSTSDDTPSSVISRWKPCPFTKAVNRAVMPLTFRKSMRRVSMLRTSFLLPTEMRLVIGSMTTAVGLNSRTRRCSVTRCCSKPLRVGRLASMRSWPDATCSCRLIFIDAMLRNSCAGDSSKANRMQRPPSWHIFSAKPAARVVLAVPAVPVMSTLLPS